MYSVQGVLICEMSNLQTISKKYLSRVTDENLFISWGYDIKNLSQGTM